MAAVRGDWTDGQMDETSGNKKGSYREELDTRGYAGGQSQKPETPAKQGLGVACQSRKTLRQEGLGVG